MKTLRRFDDLRPYGLNILTGEACGLGMRYLTDVTEAGKKLIEKVLDVNELSLQSNWNSGSIGSIMLTQEFIHTCMIFALLQNGCIEVWEDNATKELYGMEDKGDLDGYLKAAANGIIGTAGAA